MVKALTFEEWAKEYHNGNNSQFNRECFDQARIGMVPTDSVITVPEVGDWPEWALVLELRFTGPGNQQFYRGIPRPVPAWTPKVGDAVFVGDWIGVFVGKTHDHIAHDGKDRVMIRKDEYITDWSDIKPFNPAYIGKTWSEIPN